MSEPRRDLDAIVQVTSDEIEKRDRGYFRFWHCQHCDTDLFHLFTDRGIWYFICDFCHEKYELQYDGSVEILREGD